MYIELFFCFLYSGSINLRNLEIEESAILKISLFFLFSGNFFYFGSLVICILLQLY